MYQYIVRNGAAALKCTHRGKTEMKNEEYSSQEDCQCKVFKPENALSNDFGGLQRLAVWCRAVDDGVEEQDREAASKAQDVRNARLIVMTDLASLAPAQPTLVFAYYP